MIDLQLHRWVATSARVLASGALLAACLQALAIPVSSRAALNGNDTLVWSGLGGDFDEVTPLPASVSSAGGVGASVSNGGGGGLWRFDEGAGSFLGNFASGDALLATLFEPGPISIRFDTGLSSIGAQIMANDYGAFDGVISVYDDADLLLETYTVAGTASDAADNSALFLGITRNAGDIRRVDFAVSASAFGNLDLAINQMDLRAGRIIVNPTPEPASLALLLLALAGSGIATRRRRR